MRFPRLSIATIVIFAITLPDTVIAAMSGSTEAAVRRRDDSKPAIATMAPTCADGWQPYEVVQRHIIIVTGNGEPVRPVACRRRNRNGQWEYKVRLDSFGTSREEQAKQYDWYLKALVENILKSRHTRLMIFIHGGMNFVSGSAKHAVELVGAWKDKAEGFNIDSRGYPIFICWDSPPTGYREQVTWVRAGKTEKYGRSVGRRIYALGTLPLHILADIGRASTRFPAELFEFGYNDLYSIDPRPFTEFKKMREETQYIRGEIPSPTTHKKIEPTAKRVELDDVPKVPPTPKRYLQDVSTVLFFPIRHLSMPLIDGVGVGAWNNMLRHTETMFDRTDTETRHQHTPVEEEVANDQTGAMAMFLAKLRDNRPPSGTYEITLIGHSMGAIIANRILISYPYPEFRYSNIVYMAAACSVRDFQNSVVPTLLRNGSSHFYGLSLHPRCEAGEFAIPGRFPLDLAPRGSLLVWIDNIFGNPPSEDQRRFGIYQTAVLSSHNIPEQVREQVSLKCFPVEGDEPPSKQKGYPQLILSPRQHGDFSNSPYWNEAFWANGGHKPERPRRNSVASD